MEIKGPIVPPEFRNIHLELDEQKTSTAQAPKTATTSDSVETAKANFLEEQLQAAQQEGNTGEAHLNSEQQDLVSKFHPENEHLGDASFFVKDARSANDDHNKSGSQLTFGARANSNAGKLSQLTDAQKGSLFSPTPKEQTSGAVKDADRLITEGLRKAFDDDIADKNSSLNALVGSQADRLKDLLDPTAVGPGSDTPIGKGQLAYETSSTQKNPDGTATRTTDKTYQDDKGMHIVHKEESVEPWSNLDGLLWDKAGVVLPYEHVDKHTTQTDYLNDNTKIVTDTKVTTSKGLTGGAQTNTTTTTTTTKPDGTVVVTTENKNEKEKSSGGQATTTTTTTTTTTPPADGTKSYDPETYHGNIPAAIQRLTDLFKQQMQNLKPEPGGEKAHTTGDDTTISGTPGNLIAKQGNLGLLGNPGDAPQGHAGTYTGGSNPSLNGGSTDFGPDSDKSGWTGVTRQDDPGDVQFGPQPPVAGMRGSQSAGNTGTTFDSASLREAIENLWKLDPTALSRFFENMKKPE